MKPAEPTLPPSGGFTLIRHPGLTLAVLLGLAGFPAMTAPDPAQGAPDPDPPAQTSPAWTLDFRYAPTNWQTSICLPDDWQKTLVGKDGSLLYDYPGPFADFGTRITTALTGRSAWTGQELVSPRVPVVRTVLRSGVLEIVQTAFAVAPRIPPAKADKPPRHDLVIVRLRNTGTKEAQVTPTLTVESQSALTPDGPRHRVQVAPETTVFSSLTFEYLELAQNRLVAHLMPVSVAASGEKTYALAVARGSNAADLALDVAQAEALLRRAERYWREQDLPYDRITVPDPGVQALVDSSIRNIYQAREIKKGLPAFQVGPTCYRGLWVVDGSFLLEAVTYLGRTEEARQGIRYLMSFQREDGAFMLIDGHWKETGIALWAITRHARLTGDQAWLKSVWPGVEKGWAFILKMRTMAPADAPNAGLVPDGFSDGGLAGKVPEYTNVYWTMAGMRAALQAARWLGHSQQADAWQKDYDDFCQSFRRAAARDLRSDPQGNRYLPIRMNYDSDILPQKAQWAFLHAVFPGNVFVADDPLVQGNLAMLKAVESEGLVFDTGWLRNGLWNYFGSFYAHAWLWLGNGGKAAETLYAFGNHASPLLTWREEHMPLGKGPEKVGDMPHNWASAEFIRLVRHALVLERGNELHLFEAMPPSWARPGTVTALNDVVTEFGPLSLEFRVSGDGKSGHLRLITPTRPRPGRVVLHLDSWSGRTGTTELSLRDVIETEIAMNPPP